VFLLIYTPASIAKELVPSVYISIAERHNVPQKLLYAVAMVESRTLYKGKARPWPWTLNVSGKPFFFDTKIEALHKLNSEIQAGNKDVAIGIMQIFWRYHKNSFDRPGDILDPVANVTYGAKFLRRLYERHGDWITAVGKYYSGSSTPKGVAHAKEYAGKVAEQWEKLY
jgi:soluble lytic murein transglycosylase-like protein